MSEATLAEKLRAYMEAENVLASALEALRTEGASWTDDERACYLRDHDDRQSEIDALTAEVEKWKGRYYDVADAVARESTGVEDLCRQARQTRETCDALTARVRELEAKEAEWADVFHGQKQRIATLEATLPDEHSRLAQEEAKPAAIWGVVENPKYAVIRDHDGVLSTRAQFTRYMAEQDMRDHKRMFPRYGYRVVAIVDPDAIVPLASGEPKAWATHVGGVHAYKPAAEFHTKGFITPLYPGIAQPAQEREG
jgi:BMFP domain-containing protein YqiC